MSDYQKAYRLLRYGQNLLAVQATIGRNNSQVREYRVRLLVDTGASYTILPVKALEDLGYDIGNPIRRQRIFTGQGRLDVPIINLSWFNCAGQLIENFDVCAHNIPPNFGIDGLLGMDFLTGLRAMISVGNAEIRFE